MVSVSVFRRGGRMRSRIGRLRRALPRTAYVATWLRYQAESRVLAPGADRLPERVLRFLASVCAASELPTQRLYRDELQATHGLRGLALWHATFERLRFGYLDVVYLARGAARGGDAASGFCTDVTVPADVERHLRSGRPLIVVCAHFPFASVYAAAARLRALQESLDRSDAVLGMVAAEVVGTSSHPGAKREVLRSQLHEEALAAIGKGHPAVHHVFVSRRRASSTASQLVRETRSANSVTMITLDREWTSGSAYVRPFAGFAEWGLSTGWARLAMAANAGVVAISPGPGRGAGTVEWSPMRQARDFEDVTHLIDCFADDLERRIGRLPAGYQLALGRPRRWDAAADSWVMTSL